MLSLATTFTFLLVHFLYYSTRIAHRHAVGGNVTCHHAARTNNCSVANGDSRADGYIASNPAFLTNPYRTAHLELTAFVYFGGVFGCEDMHSGRYERLASNVNAASIENRGMYFGLDDLPGPYSCDMSDIADWINDAENVRVRYAGKYESMKDWSCRSDDGRVSARVINAVFRGDESECRVLSGFVSDKKKRLLINGGSFAMNGVTTSLLTLLNMLDYEKYDVSLMVIPDERSMDNIMKVNDNVRVLCRVGQIPFDIGELIRHRKIVRRGLNDRLYRELTADGPYRRNYIRSFGGSTFDTVIDYSGYGITQPLTLMQCEGAKRVIWQHNDLLLDLTNSQKKKRGVYRRSSATPIESLVTLYDYFDEVVSCSEAIMQTNRRNLSTEATYSKFTFSTNPIDFDRIQEEETKLPQLLLQTLIIQNWD